MAENENDHPVGYGRPPKHSQFKPGTSGNPSGRPKGRRSLKSDLAAALDAPMPGATGGISKQQMLVENLVNLALAGDGVAMKTLLALNTSLLKQDEESEDELTSQQLKLIEDFDHRQEIPDSTPAAPQEGDDRDTQF
jgi:hypothetical protein